MFSRRLPPGTSLLLASILGCAVPQATPPPDVDRLALGVECEDLRSNFPERFAQLIDSPKKDVASSLSPSESDHNILVLSAGGRDGAYSAGVLVGWSATGTRPTFDVVTGISTGALIAPMAFLGQSYDKLLVESYTKVRTEDIYRRRAWLAVLLSDSLADSGPLRHRIDEQVTDAFLSEIAKAHRDGRRLYIGTTNLETGKLAVWDMGAIAAGSDPNKRELFRKIILASCAIPGLFPPVTIDIEVDGRRYSELHADGGISSSMFLHPLMVVDKRGCTDTNVYAIVAGKLSPEPRQVNRQFISVFGASIQEMLDNRTQGDLLRIFLLSRLTGGRFAVAAIPKEFSIDPDATRFEPAEMKKLFEEGVAQASKGWRFSPPGVNPEEWPRPRKGTQFRTLDEKATVEAKPLAKP